MDYEHMMTESLHSKFISQSIIHRPLHKYLKCLFVCRNNGWLIKNHELGVHKDKIWAESSTGDHPNIPKFIQPICTNQPMIWDIF